MHRGHAVSDLPAPLSSGLADEQRLAEISGHLLTSRSVLIVGAPGFGKSHLADAVAELLEARGAAAMRIRAQASSHTVAFGALTGSSTRELADAFAGGEPITAARVFAYAVQHSSTDSPAVIIVDDAHLLDAATMTCLNQLAFEGALALLLTSDPVATVRVDETDPVTIRLLDALWIKGGAERIDLEPMSPAQTADLVREFAPTETFDLITLAQLHEGSGGSRVLLRELTALVARGAHGSTARDPAPRLRPAGRIVELLAHQLRSLTGSQIAAMALLAHANGVEQSRAAAICNRVELRDLVQRGLVQPTTAGGGDILRVNGLVGDAALASCDPAQLGDLSARLVHRLLLDRKLGMTTTSAECLLIADQWVQAGTIAPRLRDEWGDDVVSEVLLVASRRSSSMNHPGNAVLYAWLAGQIRPGIRSLIGHSRALAGDNRFAPARALLNDAAALVRTSDDGVQLVEWRLTLARVSSEGPDALAALALEAAEWFESGAMAGELAFIGLVASWQRMNWVRVSAEGEALAQDEAADPGTRIRAACLGSLGYAYLGRATRALELLDWATTLNHSDGRHGATESFSAAAFSLKIFHHETLVRCMSGLNVHGLAAQLHQRVDRAVRDRDEGEFGVLSLIAATLARYHGDTAQTVAELRRSEAHFAESDAAGWQPWVQCQLAGALARVGSVDAARVLMATVNAHVCPDEVNGNLSFEAHRAALALLIATGNIDGALALTDQLLLDDGGQSPVMRSWLVHVRVDLGESAADLIDSLQLAVDHTDAPLLLAGAQQVRALADGDAVALDRASSRLDGLGAWGRAAWVSEEAALLHAEHDNRAAAALSRIQGKKLRAMAAGLPPAGRPVVRAPRTAFTRREAEIMTLATQGRTNRDIAAALFLSVRTVESHLYKARIKLGARTPAEVAGEPDRPSPQLA
ncbi:LuxR C-terminal-related transcriptional regulator [Cryobacterium melibiosiphilum]|uniref:LuxR C-terminal-related transcriptional regulator n=1 Tax=Cryobacterium melibiosiphilum TaxID=995039 RepID=UPI001313D8E4|nr:LuxR C-terminal-related transcriptional regulator [Cryobacterium melibiosiphilum]